MGTLKDWINGASGASSGASSKATIDDWVNGNVETPEYKGSSYTPAPTVPTSLYRVNNADQQSAKPVKPVLPPSLPINRLQPFAIKPPAPVVAPTNEELMTLNPEYYPSGNNVSDITKMQDKTQQASEYDKFIMSQPAKLTVSEQQAQSLKSDKKAYQSLVNSDQYIQSNIPTWSELATNGQKLSTAQMAQAKDARDALGKVMRNITGAIGGIPKDKSEAYHNYEALYLALDNKIRGGAAFMANTSNALSGGFLANPLNAAGKQNNVTDPTLKAAFAQYNPFSETTQQHPTASTLGNIAGGTIGMLSGSAVLDGLGFAAKVGETAAQIAAKQAIKNGILGAASSGASAIANGEPAWKVGVDMVVGAASFVFGAAVAGKVGKSAMNQFSAIGLSPTTIQKVILAGKSGLAFGATSTALEEGKTAAYQGKSYSPDVAGIVTNLVTMTLFGALEGFKSDPRVVRIQEDLKAGKPEAEAAAVLYLNDVAKQENIVKDLESKLTAPEQKLGSVNAADILDRRRQIQQRDYATARESLSRIDAENQIVTAASDYLTSNSLKQMEQSGAMTSEVGALKKAYNKAFQIQQRLNWLTENGGKASEIVDAERALTESTAELQTAQDRVVNYLRDSGVPTPVNSTAATPQEALQRDVVLPVPAEGQAAQTGADKAQALNAEANPTVTENKPVKTNITPRPAGEIPAGQVERGFTRNVRTDTAMTPEIRKEFDVSPESYKQLGNSETLAKAQKIFDGGADKALSYLNQKIGQGKIDAHDVPLSRMIANGLVKQGNVEGARAVISDVALKLTEAGQLGQAAKILRNADPISVENSIQKAVDSINAELGKKGSKYQAKFTPEELDLIRKTDFSKEGAYEEVYTQIAKRIGGEMPSTLWEKLKEVRRVFMLLNPKTQIRNVAGNVPLAGMRKISETMAGGVQDVLVKMGALDKAKQTRTIFVNKESRTLAKELFAANKDTLVNNSDKWDMNSMIRQYRKIFGQSMAGKAADATRAFTYKILEKGDMPFLRDAFIDNASQHIAAQGYKSLDVVPSFVVERATQQALEATFRDASTLARLLNQMKAKGGLGGGALEILFPFTTTPINIAKRTYEYSPLGAVKVISDIMTHQEGVKIIDSITKTLTGSGIVALGFYLKSLGAITGAADKDPDKANFDKATGSNPYSFAGKVSYDWLQPTGSLMAMGAQIYDSSKDNANALEAIWKSVLSAGDAYLNLTFFQNIISMFKGYGSISENVVNTLTKSGTSQFAPSLIGSLTRSVDPVVRSAQTGGNFLQDAAAGFMQKTPGASSTLPASVNVKGEANMRIENPLARSVQEFLNPASVNTNKSNSVDAVLQTLYKSTGDKTIFPKTAPNAINGVNLTGVEKSHYQTALGKTTYGLLEQEINSPEFNTLNDQQKVKVINDIIAYASDVAKQEYAGTPTKEPDNLSTLLVYKQAFNDVSSSKGQNSEAFEKLSALYSELAPLEQNQIAEGIGNSAFNKMFDVIDSGADIGTYYQFKEMLPVSDVKDVRNKLLTDTNLNQSQKKAIYSSLFTDKYYEKYEQYGSTIPASSFISILQSENTKKGTITRALSYGLSKKQINALCEANGWTPAY